MYIHHCASFFVDVPRQCGDVLSPGAQVLCWHLWSGVSGCWCPVATPPGHALPVRVQQLCGVTWKQLQELGSTLFLGRPAGGGRAFLWLVTLWLAFES